MAAAHGRVTDVACKLFPPSRIPVQSSARRLIMSKVLSGRVLAAVVVFGAAIGAAFALRAADNDSGKAVTAADGAAAKSAAGRYFEMRTYHAAPGKIDALHARFRDHTMKLFKKHGIESVAYWTAVDEKNAGKLYFVIAYPDKASRDTLWNAFGKDPEWVKAKDESEKNGKLVD